MSPCTTRDDYSLKHMAAVCLITCCLCRPGFILPAIPADIADLLLKAAVSQGSVHVRLLLHQWSSPIISDQCLGPLMDDMVCITLAQCIYLRQSQAALPDVLYFESGCYRQEGTNALARLVLGEPIIQCTLLPHDNGSQGVLPHTISDITKQQVTEPVTSCIKEVRLSATVDGSNFSLIKRVLTEHTNVFLPHRLTFVELGGKAISEILGLVDHCTVKRLELQFNSLTNYQLAQCLTNLTRETTTTTYCSNSNQYIDVPLQGLDLSYNQITVGEHSVHVHKKRRVLTAALMSAELDAPDILHHTSTQHVKSNQEDVGLCDWLQATANTIRDLKLAGNRIRTLGPLSDRLAHCYQLSHLDLSACSLTPTAIKELASISLPSLLHLNLSANYLCPDLKAIRYLCRMLVRLAGGEWSKSYHGHYLRTTWNRLNKQQGIQRSLLHHYIPARTLETLNLSSIGLMPLSVAMIAPFIGLHRNMTCLYLHSNPMNAASVESLTVQTLPYMPDLRDLGLLDCGIEQDQTLCTMLLSYWIHDARYFNAPLRLALIGKDIDEIGRDSTWLRAMLAVLDMIQIV